MVQSRVCGGQCKAGNHVTTHDIEVNFSTSVSLSILDLKASVFKSSQVYCSSSISLGSDGV